MDKKELLIAIVSIIVVFFAGYVAGSNTNTLMLFVPRNSSDLAAWVGAIGSVSAVIAAIWIMDRQNSLSEKSLVAERYHEAEKQAKEHRDRIAICLLVATHTSASIISILDTLETTKDNDLAWTIANQISMLRIFSEPTLRIPMHELGTVEAVQSVFAVNHLSQRLAGCLDSWSKASNISVAYITDVKETAARLKPEAVEVHTAISQSIVRLNEVR
jgi:hypothetical protein